MVTSTSVTAFAAVEDYNSDDIEVRYLNLSMYESSVINITGTSIKASYKKSYLSVNSSKTSNGKQYKIKPKKAGQSQLIIETKSKCFVYWITVSETVELTLGSAQQYTFDQKFTTKVEGSSVSTSWRKKNGKYILTVSAEEAGCSIVKLSKDGNTLASIGFDVYGNIAKATIKKGKTYTLRFDEHFDDFRYETDSEEYVSITKILSSGKGFKIRGLKKGVARVYCYVDGEIDTIIEITVK